MILKAGAKAVFVDCDLEHAQHDGRSGARRALARTRAIVPTHFGGAAVRHGRHPRPRERAEACRVVEDAALAIGSRSKGRVVGPSATSPPSASIPNKNMTTDRGRRGRCFRERRRGEGAPETLRFHGIRKLADGTRDVDYPGGKFNLSDVSARLGLAQLERLDAWCALRRSLADATSSASQGRAGSACRPRRPGRGSGHSWNMFCVRLPFETLSMSRAAIHRGDARARHRHRHLLRGDAPRHASSAPRATARANSPTPSASRARPSRCRCTPR
jgi:dTDP-4-amino-4,6-dideoxygalactose transaminase